jgi:hypothetical protein
LLRPVSPDFDPGFTFSTWELKSSWMPDQLLRDICSNRHPPHQERRFEIKCGAFLATAAALASVTRSGLNAKLPEGGDGCSDETSLGMPFQKRRQASAWLQHFYPLSKARTPGPRRRPLGGNGSFCQLGLLLFSHS